MITTSMLGSLHMVPKRNVVHGSGDDGTSTRWHKAQAMSGQINLRNPQHRRRPADGTGIVIGACLGALMSGIVALVVLAAVRWAG
jgi:hypothetical protein